MTTGPVLRLLRLDRLGAAEAAFSRRLVERLRAGAFGRLFAAADAGALPRSLVEVQAGLATADEPDGGGEEGRQRLALSEILFEEQQAYERQLQDGRVSQAAYVQLSLLVNERLDSLESRAYDELACYPFPVLRESRVEKLVLPLLRRVRRDGLRHRRARRLEVLVTLRLTLAEIAAATPEEAGLQCLAGWRGTVDRLIERFYEDLPGDASAVQALFAADTVRGQSRGVLAELLRAGLVSQAVAASAARDIDTFHRNCTSGANRRQPPKGPSNPPEI